MLVQIPKDKKASFLSLVIISFDSSGTYASSEILRDMRKLGKSWDRGRYCHKGVYIESSGLNG